LRKGLVIKSTGSWYYVKEGKNAQVACKIKGNFRIRGIRATNPVAVGDHVVFTLMDDGSGLITKIDQRKNYIIRRASNLSKEYQLIASNVDQSILLTSLSQPKTLLGFIDRYLVSAEAFRIPVILVFNKTDIYTEEENQELEHLLRLYRKIQYQCLAISLKNGHNLDQLKEVFKEKVTVIAGNSGVGKSTLINFLDPTLEVRTSKISEYHKTGQHTTTNAEMYFLPSGGKLIDTPGIKGFGMVDIEKTASLIIACM
jgi:ribosome biogenesis GTPase